EYDHGPVLEDFVNWCDQSFLHINVSKTNEMFIDFQRRSCLPAPCVIKGELVAAVQQYKYLGTILDDKLNFDVNTDAVCKKANQRLFFLRKLKSFNVDRTTIKLFYSAFIESILSFNIVGLVGNLSLKNKSKLEKVVKLCCKITGVTLNNQQHLYDERITSKAWSIVSDSQHPLHVEFQMLLSGRRFCLNATMNVPSAIAYLNQQ
ncbi:DUF1891 domain-containing protein, partial [Vibrio parahaemolyticus]|nr:DUF1891 domain-containing protein [Vibrio parahaemolyticus]